ncbi:hypothetical protein EJB05_26665, partial [Eragrostis curvula]
MLRLFESDRSPNIRRSKDDRGYRSTIVEEECEDGIAMAISGDPSLVLDVGWDDSKSSSTEILAGLWQLTFGVLPGGLRRWVAVRLGGKFEMLGGGGGGGDCSGGGGGTPVVVTGKKPSMVSLLPAPREAIRRPRKMTFSETWPCAPVVTSTSRRPRRPHAHIEVAAAASRASPNRGSSVAAMRGPRVPSAPAWNTRI